MTMEDNMLHEEGESLSLNVVKILLMISMILATFLSGVLPHKLIKMVHCEVHGSLWRRLLSLCSCFSGGVFIGACMLDLFPEAEEKMDEILEEVKIQYGVELDYPVTNLLICCGFFMILTLEQGAMGLKERWAARRHSGETQPLLHTHHEYEALSGVSGEDHHHHHAHHAVLQHSTLRSLMLLIALSFHSVFEGIAIGLQDNSGDLLSIFLAVMVHKALMAFSLGLNMAQSDLSLKSFILSNIVFTLASPLGIMVGILMTGLPPSLPNDICNGVLQCLAGGTFIYITFFEVLPNELNAPGNRLQKVIFVILGFIAICGVLSIAE